MSLLSLIECNLDGLIGPTHHFGGLGVGNMASAASQHRTSHPRRAALEGIAKMQMLMELGIPQFFLPPPVRPKWDFLSQMGFDGRNEDALKRCEELAPEALSAAYSSSFMWTANAATVAPSTDSTDGKFHLLLANLCSNLHRGMEWPERTVQLETLFAGVAAKVIHAPLPSTLPLRDEGAANHLRLCSPRDRSRGMHVFVHGSGEGALSGSSLASAVHRRQFPRQGMFASRSAANILRLPPVRCSFVQQSPIAIDAGVFHNDVIATSHDHLLLYHEHAFADQANSVGSMAERFESMLGEPLIGIRVSERQLSLQQGVETYLFNSQMVTLAEGGMCLVCPEQCQRSVEVQRLIQGWIDDPKVPIVQVAYVALHESMANGGGPACLRLRLDLTPSELERMDGRFRLTPQRAEALRRWVNERYPEQVTIGDLTRIEFAEHARGAVESFPL